MARGGYRPGGGRPKGSRNKKTLAAPKQIKRAARKLRMTPLDYMLAVMNDEAADASRRDRMAIAAAPFVHCKPGEKGKKEHDAEAARAAMGSPEWGDDLAVPLIGASRH